MKGSNGMRYENKKFSVGMGGGHDVKLRHGLKEGETLPEIKIPELPKVEQKIKKIIPFGDRILVKRLKIGEKIGSGILFAADSTADNETELAEVVYVPDNSFADKQLIENAEAIIAGLTEKMKTGDSHALDALTRFNSYLRIKSLRVGDKIFMGKYVGTNFTVQETGARLTLVDNDGIIGLVVER